VAADLWQATRENFRIHDVPGGHAGALDANQQSTVDGILAFYGKRDAQWLSDLTHMEDPWKTAYARGQNTEVLSEYYSSLGANEAAEA